MALGNASPINSNAPVNVIGLDSGVKGLAVGDEFACAPSEESYVKCWGVDSGVPFGNEYGGPAWVPRPPDTPDSDSSGAI
jgi:hypothetical protein